MQDEPLELAGEFDAVDERDWRAAVDKVLGKGKQGLSREDLDALFARRLTATTYDGVRISALYARKDLERAIPPGLPGLPPFVRGTTPTGAVGTGWDVRQRVDVTGDGSAAAEVALDELANGATSLWLGLTDVEPAVEILDRALRGVKLDLAPVALEAGAGAVTAAQSLVELWRARGIADAGALGSLGLDPIGETASSGATVDAVPAVEVVKSVAGRFPGVRALRVDAARYHEAGASEAEEVACALATGVAYLRLLAEAGVPIDAAAAQIEFRFSATVDQFLTIAKLRAARLAWSRVAEVAGASAAARGQWQHAVTSRAMISRYDPWVNLLRATLAGFAAGVGGAAAVTVLPHDQASAAGVSELGRRLARNTQAILVEEAHLARVVDPAGGSWYVENLTSDLARAAWKCFGEIEATGGIAAALDAGTVQERIAATGERRAKNLARRRDVLTGVSEFPNIADEVPLPAPAPRRAARALPVVRWATPFEDLRARADREVAAGRERPAVFLAALGPLAEHTPRVSFSKNLFEAGGIRGIVSSTVDASSVAADFRESGARLACICGSNERYASEAEAVARALAAENPARLYLAGDPGPAKEALHAAGVAEIVVAGGDAVTTLAKALDAAGVQP